MLTVDLFEAMPAEVWEEAICPGAIVLRQFAAQAAPELLQAILLVTDEAVFRKMQTPCGGYLSAGLSSCGDYGWVSDHNGYRYSAIDPLTSNAWPDMPDALRRLGIAAASAAGYEDFEPDVCLINSYEPGAKMGLHQDKNERDFSAPIVSVSLGIPAMFQFGGRQRADKPLKIPLQHGDVVVWGGEARLNFHGVLTVRKAWHPLTGDKRFNLTFRKAR